MILNRAIRTIRCVLVLGCPDNIRYSMRGHKRNYGNSTLTDDQKSSYEQNGYILIKNNVSNDLVDKMHQRFIDICDNNADNYIGQIIIDPILRSQGLSGQYVINKLQDFLYDPVLWEYVVDKNVIGVVEQIIGPNITGVHSMLINKPPDSHPDISKHPLHQDLLYFPFRPADKIVASWTAMEKVDEQNGCLYVVPGSHEPGQLYEHGYPKGEKNTLYHGVQGMDHLPRVNVPMEKGDSIFFHPLLLHGSGPNFTKGFRKAISCHYASSDCYFIDVVNTVQENIGKEVEVVAGRKGGKISFQDVFRWKSRLAKGFPGNYQRLESHL